MEKIKTGIASYGMSGSVFHAPFLEKNPKYELSTIVERTKNLSQATYPNVRIARSVEEMIADPALELIVVNTPHPTHFDYCKQALLAGKHVVCEKPFVFGVEHAVKLNELAEKAGRKLIVFQNRRWDGDFLTTKKVVESGVLGKVTEFVTSYLLFRGLRGNIWKEDPVGRTGLTYDLGSHLVDQVLLLFGLPKGVWSTMEVMRDGSRIVDYFMINMLYDGLRVTVKGSYVSRGDTTRFIVNGRNGSFVKCGLDPQEDRLKLGEMPGSPGWGEEPESAWGVLDTTTGGIHVKGKVETVAGNYMDFYESVYDCIRNGAPEPVRTAEVIDELRVLEAAHESYETGRTVWF
ncbi:MAG: Gfo/Idh/MocA family oxidoreductase [Rikenellaceae bacterium]|jgi:predicted dehydrogenase|nr:Gfo/Idh/MocA family oxidoreductase [Rikenellaceae bacterium]